MAGRFQQTDPVGYESDVNSYAYVLDDPINHADPDGESCANGQGTCSTAELRHTQEKFADYVHREVDPDTNGAIAKYEGGATLAGIAAGASVLGGGALIDLSFGPKVGRVFWSGFGARAAATEYAAENGGTTLGQTFAGRAVSSLTDVFGSKNTEGLLYIVSSVFAINTKGPANVFLGEKLRPGNIWETIERPNLVRGGNRIIEHPVSPPAKPSTNSFPKPSETPEGCPLRSCNIPSFHF